MAPALLNPGPDAPRPRANEGADKMPARLVRYPSGANQLGVKTMDEEELSVDIADALGKATAVICIQVALLANSCKQKGSHQRRSGHTNRAS